MHAKKLANSYTGLPGNKYNRIIDTVISDFFMRFLNLTCYCMCLHIALQ